MFVILGFIGIVVGFASGFFGIGGGTILVPTLIYLGFGVKAAISISITQMVFSSIFGSFVNYKNKMLRLESGLVLGFGGFLGAQFSGYIVSSLPPVILLGFFATALLASLYKFFKAPSEPTGVPNESKLLLFIIGFFVGMAAISIGIGGALFLTPIMVGFLYFDIKRAVSTSLLFVVFSSVSGLISFSIHGLVDYKAGIILGLGSLIGVYFGAKKSHTVKRDLQKKLLMVLYVILFALTVNKLIGLI
ncbi:MAG: sulfite exporter TauE/SafE family protein [Epsilonproteobacteria bacterium]|nr:sulfite exporter TauE/SafE family protein [Campylobacterota bacterium]